MDGILDQSVKEVSQVFPDVDVEVIRKDLNLTLNAEQTINRILDGTVYNSSPEKSGSAWTCSSTDVNSDSDLELPILTQRVRPTNLILRLSDQASTSNDVIDLSQDEDLSDTVYNSSPEKSGSAWTCSSTDVNSDSDLELPILTQRVRPTNLILRLSDQASTSNDVIDLSQDEDLSDTVYNSSPEKSGSAWTCSSTDVNSDSDLELPILTQRVRPTNLILRLSDQASTSNDVIDLSQDEDLSDTVYNSSPEKSGSAWTCSSTDVNSDSDLELPILTQRVRPTNLILRLSDQASTSNDVIDLSQDEDLSDTDVNSDDEELPDLESATLKYKPDNQIDLTHEVILTSDSDNTVLESKDNCDPLENISEKTCSPLHQDISVKCMSEQQPLEMSDSEDSAPGDSLANRLGLAQRCGFSFKLGVSSKTSTDCVEEDYSIPDSFRGIKRKNGANILVEAGQTDNMIAMSEDAPAKKSKKKRTAEEIAESKRQAEEKRAARQHMQEEKKAQKQREIEMRRALQENKRHFRAGDCVKYLTVCVDPGVINAGQLGAGVFKVCSDLGAKCVTEPQLVPNTITWTREVLDCQQDTAVKRAVLEDDILTMLPLQDFIAMVQTYVQNQQGLRQPGCVTLKEFIQNLQGIYPTKTVAVFVVGKEKYFSDLKLSNKRNHREAVLGAGGAEGLKQKKSKKGGGSNIVITRVQMEEALIDAQLHTSCIVQFPESSQDAADLVKSFTKAVADKPAKKDRLENVFDFLAEGAAGVKVDKSGAGLLKVWKHQLLQFKNVGPDMAEAIISAYPSPRLLYQAYQNCSSEKEGQKLLENIVVRRGAGVLVTNRRIGKELSRRIHSLFQSKDANFIIK